jgi:hypothetical protein
MRGEIEALNSAIGQEFAVLTRPRLGHQQLPPGHLGERLDALEARFILLRSLPEKLFLSLPLEVARAFVAHYSAIHRVCEDLPFPSLREAMTGLEDGMRKTRDTGLLIQQDLDGVRNIVLLRGVYLWISRRRRPIEMS